jgi:hypothetical protein
VNAVIDPMHEVAMCGRCGLVYLSVAHADECCVVPGDPPAYRTVIAGSLVLLAMIYLFVLLPWLS